MKNLAGDLNDRNGKAGNDDAEQRVPHMMISIMVDGIERTVLFNSTLRIKGCHVLFKDTRNIALDCSTLGNFFRRFSLSQKIGCVKFAHDSQPMPLLWWPVAFLMSPTISLLVLIATAKKGNIQQVCCPANADKDYSNVGISKFSRSDAPLLVVFFIIVSVASHALSNNEL